MKHLGDITKISGYTAPVVDIITGGSPCQDLSVAGKRAGLAGERSGLFMEQMRIIREMREKDAGTGRTGWAVRPRYMVWENVPGAFSSGKPKGADFAAVIEEIIKVAEPGADVCVCVPERGWTKAGCYYSADGKWSIAWRVHDAQFWGVPQRRKRIALVADFGGLSAPEILFERKGVCWNSEPSGAQRERTAAGAEDGAGSTVYGIDHVITTGGNCTAQGPCFYEEVEATLKAAGPHAVAYGVVSKGNGEAFLTEERHTSLSTGGGEPGQGYPCVMSFQERAGKPGGGKGILMQYEHVGALSTLNNQSVCYSIGHDIRSARMTDDEITDPLTATDYKQPQTVYIPIHDKATRYQGGGSGRHDDGGWNALGIGSPDSPVWALSTADRHMVACVENSTCQDVTGALTPGAHPGSYNGQDAYNDMLVATPIVFDKEMYNAGEKMSGVPQARYDNVAPTVRADSHPSGVCQSVVRRLTPMECERLQGFPDGWTDIGEWTDSKGKKHKDASSPRYKALGNSIALPFWAWLARRICAQYERPMTMASLFDGIGGFPLVFSRAGATPVWASEIEEFPIAVTKIHFPEEGET